MIHLWFTYDLLIIYLKFTYITYDLLMIQFYFTYDLLMIYLWWTYDSLVSLMIYLCLTYNLLMIDVWFTCDTPMIYSWCIYFTYNLRIIHTYDLHIYAFDFTYHDDLLMVTWQIKKEAFLTYTEQGFEPGTLGM